MKTRRIHMLCITIAGLTALALQGCATTASQRLDQKLSQKSTIESQKQLRAAADESIEHGQGLTPDQRKRLTELKKATEARTDEIKERSLKLRSILVQDLLSSNYDTDEVDLIKGRLSDLEDQRLKITFDAVSKANDIMGRNATDKEPIFEDLMVGHGSRD